MSGTIKQERTKTRKQCAYNTDQNQEDNGIVTGYRSVIRPNRHRPVGDQLVPTDGASDQSNCSDDERPMTAAT
jgi:hypothetical protein